MWKELIVKESQLKTNPKIMQFFLSKFNQVSSNAYTTTYLYCFSSQDLNRLSRAVKSSMSLHLNEIHKEQIKVLAHPVELNAAISWIQHASST